MLYKPTFYLLTYLSVTENLLMSADLQLFRKNQTLSAAVNIL